MSKYCTKNNIIAVIAAATTVLASALVGAPASASVTDFWSDITPDMERLADSAKSAIDSSQDCKGLEKVSPKYLSEVPLEGRLAEIREYFVALDVLKNQEAARYASNSPDVPASLVVKHANEVVEPYKQEIEAKLNQAVEDQKQKKRNLKECKTRFNDHGVERGK